MLSPANASKTLMVLKKNIERTISLDCGVENMDIVIVSNRSSTITEECVDYLDEINGAKTPYGKIIILERQNSGGSLGAYSHAFDLFESDYDYWLFTEDDLSIIYENYMNLVVEEFEDEKLGFLAFTKINFRKDMSRIHVGGGFGASRTEVLSEVKKKYDRLPYDTSKSASKNYGNFGHSEQYFSNPVAELGYDIRIPQKSDVIPLADNWRLVESQVRWQNEMNFDLKNKNYLYHIGL